MLPLKRAICIAPRLNSQNAISQRLIHSASLRVSAEVQHAVATNTPVVALESTIYTHGYPYPENVELATHLESLVRSYGAVPATIGVLDGLPRVGLDGDELQRLAASASDSSTLKLSRRDLSFITGLLNGGTTVAGTMILANLAGISVFATGGLGGVHRGAETSFDISADLTELGRTPVAVISSGCKSFLDIPKTLEYLETQGVCVATFSDGESNVDFPAFWTRQSGIKSPLLLKDEAQAAAVICMFVCDIKPDPTDAQHDLDIRSGLLFANPIPETHSLPKDEIDAIINEAVREAEASGATGNLNTPFILKRIREVSNGRSVTANRFLIEHNVSRGAKVAVELSKLQKQRSKSTSKGSVSVVIPRKTFIKSQPAEAEIVVAGSIALDTACDYPSGKPQLHTSNPGQISESLGGVGLNLARAANSLNASVSFCTAVADDTAGSSILHGIESIGLENSNVEVLKNKDGYRTARYVAVNDASKDLVLAMADMSIIEKVPKETIDSWISSGLSKKTKLLMLDANWSAEALHYWTAGAETAGVQTIFEPVSVEKAARLFAASADGSRPHLKLADIASPNELELAAMFGAARENGFFERQDWWTAIDDIGLQGGSLHSQLISFTSRKLVEDGVPQQAIRLLPFVPTLLIKLGTQGVLIARLVSKEDSDFAHLDPRQLLTPSLPAKSGVYMRLIPPPKVLLPQEVVSVNGAGDTFLGVVAAGLAKGVKMGRLDDLVMLAQKGSGLTLRSKESVAENLASLQPELDRLALET